MLTEMSWLFFPCSLSRTCFSSGRATTGSRLAQSNKWIVTLVAYDFSPYRDVIPLVVAGSANKSPSETIPASLG